MRYLRTKTEIQDLYIEDLSGGIRELSYVIRHRDVTGRSARRQLPRSSTDDRTEYVEEEEEEEEGKDGVGRPRPRDEQSRLIASDSGPSWFDGRMSDPEELDQDSLSSFREDVEFKTPLSSPFPEVEQSFPYR